MSSRSVTGGLNLLGKFVSVSGFLVFGTNNKPVPLEIDEVLFEEIVFINGALHTPMREVLW